MITANIGSGSTENIASLTFTVSMAYITSINKYNRINGIHNARAQVHAHAAYILGNAVHQVAGVVAAVKSKR
jgi:hypothetical protein